MKVMAEPIPRGRFGNAVPETFAVEAGQALAPSAPVFPIAKKTTAIPASGA